MTDVKADSLTAAAPPDPSQPAANQSTTAKANDQQKIEKEKKKLNKTKFRIEKKLQKCVGRRSLSPPCHPVTHLPSLLPTITTPPPPPASALAGGMT